MTTRSGKKVISLFSGALGLDLGLEAAGFKLAVAVEPNPFAVETLKNGKPLLPVIDRPIERVHTARILQEAGLRSGEAAVVAGGPACQAFSTAGQRGSISDPRGVLFRSFLRVIRGARPRFFVMENVPGVISAAKRHRPLIERGPGHPPLARDEEFGSAFIEIVREFRKLGYYIVFDILNAADFGVPSTRKRLVFIGSRDGEPIAMPIPTHSETGSDGLKPWVTLREALRGLEDPDPEIKSIATRWRRYLKQIPAGGCWRDLPKDLQREAMGRAYLSWGGRKGFFRRLSWDAPVPALTTRPESKATMFCHPDELRTFSIREYARLQQFSPDWKFSGGVEQRYRQIGNAVPVGLGQAIGLSLMTAMRRRKEPLRRPFPIVCAGEDLMRRLTRGRRTRLNPVRMRKVKSLDATRKWLNGRSRSNGEILKYVVPASDLNGSYPHPKKKPVEN
ncbi:DNA cytosine methyltransferase [Elusimicrobiota bacterium]